ncbi:MAG: hypothetical protein J6V73_03275 [Spirochaetaceae bacterium]|nr:hypothetical protein [Spirochaetaceae bacterium]
MTTTKKVVIVAVCGFVLSFLIGLISSVSFGIVLLRAVVCALIFAGLYYALSVVFQRFLIGNSGGSEHVSGGDSIIPQKGQLIDIKVDDEILPEEENAPLFKIPKELIPESNNNAVEVLEPVENAQEVNDVKAGEKLFTTPQPQVKNENTGDSELGSLPDMESMLSDMQSSPTSEVITTSDFANSDNMIASGELRGADKELMAKAIHTVLTRDNN